MEDAIYSSGVSLDTYEDDVEIQDIKINSVHLMYLDDIEDNAIPCHFTAEVELIIEYTCIDEDHSYWDKETNSYLFAETVDLRLHKTISLDFSILVYITTDSDLKITKIEDYEDFELNDSKYGINISVDDDDEIEILHSSIDDDYEEYVPGAYMTCADCGCKINIDNDGGGGFCVNCAPNH